jgi:hypothetical protein
VPLLPGVPEVLVALALLPAEPLLDVLLLELDPEQEPSKQDTNRARHRAFVELFAFIRQSSGVSAA